MKYLESWISIKLLNKYVAAIASAIYGKDKALPATNVAYDYYLKKFNETEEEEKDEE